MPIAINQTPQIIAIWGLFFDAFQMNLEAIKTSRVHLGIFCSSFIPLPVGSR